MSIVWDCDLWCSSLLFLDFDRLSRFESNEHNEEIIFIMIAGFIVQKAHQLYKIEIGGKLNTRYRKMAETTKNHNFSENVMFGTRCT